MVSTVLTETAIAFLLFAVAAFGKYDVVGGTVQRDGNIAVIKTKLDSSAPPPVKLAHNLTPSMQVRLENRFLLLLSFS